MCQAQPSSFIQSNTGFLSCHPLLPLPSITSFLFFYIPSLISYPLKAWVGWFNIIFWPLKLAWTLLTSIPLHKSDLPCLLIWLWLPIFIFSLGSPACCWKQHKTWTRAQLSSTSVVSQKSPACKYSRTQPLQDTRELNKAHKAVQDWKGRCEGWWIRAFGSGVPLALLVLETLKILLSFMTLTWKLWTNSRPVDFRF